MAPEVLLHIGYPKTGSTFLWDYFTSNPALHVERSTFKDYIQSGKVSAIAFSKPDSEKPYIVSQEQFSVWGGELDIVGVHFKPYDIKAHQEITCKDLYTFFPNAKVLIVTRGFESAFRSMFWQYISIGGIYSFEKFQSKYSKYFAEFYDYDFLIRLYKSYFGQQVVILPFELLQEDMPKFLTVMEEKCELPRFRFNSGKVNASLNEKLASYRGLSSFIYKFIQLFPYKIQVKIYGLYVFMLYERKLSWLPNFIPTAKDFKIEDSTIDLFRGKAAILHDESIFHPYLKQYLLQQ